MTDIKGSFECAEMNLDGLVELLRYDSQVLRDRTKDEILITMKKFDGIDEEATTTLAIIKEMEDDPKFKVNVMVDVEQKGNYLHYTIFIRHSKYDTTKPSYWCILMERQHIQYTEDPHTKKGRIYRVIMSSKKLDKDEKKKIKLANKKKNINVILFQSKLQIDCVNNIMAFI